MVAIHTLPDPPGYGRKRSGLLAPKAIPERLPDFDAPRRGATLQRHAANNILGVSDAATPAEREEGRVWYPKVHDATAKGAKQHGMSMLHASGVVAAVSPNMDFDSNNIHAFGQISKLMTNPDHMAALHRSLGNRNPGGQQTRSAEWKSIVTQHYPEISKAPDVNIHKATRMFQGEDPHQVLNARTAYKTNSFMHNIADPSMTHNPASGKPMATVDGRAADVARNTMVPWTTDRGIGTSQNVRGGTTRGEHFANAYHDAADIASAEEKRPVLPSEMQARTWVTGKRIERAMPGARRSRTTGAVITGPVRSGQNYV
jgi:hypothetical protein